MQQLSRRARRGSCAPGRPSCCLLGVDEAAHKKGQDYNTVVTDPAAHDVLEVLRGRDGKALSAWLSALPEPVRAGIAAVAIDMSAPYRQVVRERLPGTSAV